MIKPLWAVAGVALVGITGVVGAVVVASPGGEEEAVQQVETATPSPEASETATPAPSPAPSPIIELPSPSPSLAACDPNPPAPPGTKLWRWGDVTVLIPEDGAVRAVGTDVGQERRPALEISADGWGRTVIDASTAAIISQDPKGDRAPQIDSVVATLSVCRFDVSSAPWPYNGDPADGPRMTIGYVSYLEPDPATGMQVLAGMAHSDGTSGSQNVSYLEVTTGRSSMYIGAESGEVMGPADIAHDDEVAFQRFLESLRVQMP